MGTVAGSRRLHAVREPRVFLGVLHTGAGAASHVHRDMAPIN